MAGVIPPTRRGYDAHEVVSALQKAIRRSNPDAALYWAAELDHSGFTAWAWKRVRVICTEDIGPAAPGVAADVRALFDNWRDEPKGARGGMYLMHAVILLATAEKSRIACLSTIWHGSDDVPRREVPDEALDRHTLRGRRMGRGDEHFREHASRLEPWTGSLAELEAAYREHFPPPGDRQNPWRQQLAQNSPSGLFGPLRHMGLDDQEER